MAKKKLKIETIKFEVEGKEYSFQVEHNMPNVFGQSLECAVNVWLEKTSDYSLKSLINYIKSKQQPIVIKEYKGQDYE